MVLAALFAAGSSGALQDLLDSAQDRVIGMLPESTARELRARSETPGAPPLRVLFVGNSLTTTNDLPAMVVQLADAAREARPFAPTQEAVGGFRLSQHLAAGRVTRELAQSPWDAVVLQEQGQLPGWTERRETEFFAPARMLAADVAAARARVVLYDTPARRDGDLGAYPGDSYDAMQERIDRGYTQLGQELRAAVVPVGKAFRALRQQRPEIALWLDDGLHPSRAGTYLAACSFYAHFYQRSPVGNAYVAGLPAADAKAIQEVAALFWKLPDAVVFAPATQPVAASALPTHRDDASESANAPRMRTGSSATDEADRARHQRVMQQIHERELQSARERVPINVYRTSWCGACERATAYMRSAGIRFEEYDVERDPEARAIARRLNPRGSVPTIDVDGTVLVGWSESHFEAALDDAARRRAR